MRWGVHWRIGRDSLHDRYSLIYQLGTILPDWFERHPIHRRKESLAPMLKRAERVRSMAPGLRKDWHLGALSHYLCDYCCLAHNDEYYNFYRHRVYEVDAQTYYKNVREKRKARYVAGQMRFAKFVQKNYPTLWDGTAKGEEFRLELRRLINETVDELHGKIAALDSEKWWVDRRVAELDVQYGYRLIFAVLCILGERNLKKEVEKYVTHSGR